MAAYLKRMPWIGYVAQRLWRLGQPWMTAGVIGAIFNETGQVLIVEHVYHPKYPWGFPGGWMNRGEDPEDTVRREVLEETGLRIQPIKPLLIMRTPYLARHLDIAYLCQVGPEAGVIQLSAELLSYRWIDPAELAQAIPMTRFHERAVQAAVAEYAALEAVKRA
jgi:8-oxo-dGTP pyrophosphatase MutT (NUDIX family)